MLHYVFAEKTAGIVHPVVIVHAGDVGQSAGWRKVTMLASAHVSHTGQSKPKL